MVRYDAAIAGAGGEGLAAAIALAAAGLKCVLIERQSSVGGRFTAIQFHPGFRAHPYCGTLAPIPAAIAAALRLAQHGAVPLPLPVSVALWPGEAPSLLATPPLFAGADVTRQAMLARAGEDAAPPQRSWFGQPPPRSWPGAAYGNAALAAMAQEALDEPRAAAHAMARAAASRGVDPTRLGSALHLLAPDGWALLPAGPSSLAAALEHRARSLGVEIVTGTEVQEVAHKSGRVRGLILAGGQEIAARAVISTLDLKQTFLSLFTWKELPPPLAARVRAWRMGGAQARLLMALEAPPVLRAGARGAALHLAPSVELFVKAAAAARDKRIADALPLTLHLASALDPSAAPPGGAVLTATASCLPHMLFDGGWTHALREALQARILAQIEAALPGTQSRLLGATLIAPPDFEEALGVSEGDPTGGELAPDQMGAFRPWTECPRTAFQGLYLAGGATTSGQLASLVSGTLAARALIADLAAGRLA